MNTKLTAAVEAYFAELKQVRASGGATTERSNHVPLANLLNAVGATLKPKVFCVAELAQQGAGHPDLGMYAASQLQDGKPREEQIPERGVVEMKAPGSDVSVTAQSDQVVGYLDRYRLVLVTNTHDFVLIAKGRTGQPERLETFSLAENAEEFVLRLEKPRRFARDVGIGLVEYICRAMSRSTVLDEPKDVARLLASYARQGLARVEAADSKQSLATIRSALEESLGVRFEGERGSHFFRSTLVQTLFYGIFSAWVLWARTRGEKDGPLFKRTSDNEHNERFEWRTSVWHLRAPVLQALFQQISDPRSLESLGLIEVLNYAGDTLDRVDIPAFFARFSEGEAVPYFYEPFLEAFDPGLRRQLGVWYTPAEVVRYMVTRVDKSLKDDLGIKDGLAAKNVYILDPCCGTGAYMADVLRRIAANLEDKGLEGLAGEELKRAATERVFGFEIMPAPLVVAHLQVGLTMQELNAPLANGDSERLNIFLTNALTGWEPKPTKPLPFPELEEERERAERVKQDTPVLVVLGNPPYNGFAEMAVDEEKELSDAYRTVKKVQAPQGHGLNDIYIRFFRMAERRITEKTGRGIVCFISNYSWLDGLSFTGMREHYLDAFDIVRIDCLNGDTRRGGETPRGEPDGSVFTTDQSVGIKVGTAISMLVRKEKHKPAKTVAFRSLWGTGQAKREKLEITADDAPSILYETVKPTLKLGLPFVKTAVGKDWFDWPALPDLFPVSFPGVKTARDGFLIDVDLDRLKTRIGDYFDKNISNEEIARRYPEAMKATAGFNAQATREELISRGGPNDSGFIRFTYRPFDNRWLYWEEDTKLLDRKRAAYKPNVFEGNIWFSAARHLRKSSAEPQACFTRHMGSSHLIERGASMFPAWIYDENIFSKNGCCEKIRPNLSDEASRYLKRLNLGVEDLFYHVLAVLHDHEYRKTNTGGLKMGWPRIPLPGWPDGKTKNAAETIVRSAELGRNLAELLDPDVPVDGVTEGELSPQSTSIALPRARDRRNMTGDDFSMTAGWGRLRQGNIVMPGPGQTVERYYTSYERAVFGKTLSWLGETTFDVYINAGAFWSNVPAAVWNYRLDGYQVLKKWLSYREHGILDRPMTPGEVKHFADTARRIGAILTLTG